MTFTDHTGSRFSLFLSFIQLVLISGHDEWSNGTNGHFLHLILSWILSFVNQTRILSFHHLVVFCVFSPLFPKSLTLHSSFQLNNVCVCVYECLPNLCPLLCSYIIRITYLHRLGWQLQFKLICVQRQRQKCLSVRRVLHAIEWQRKAQSDFIFSILNQHFRPYDLHCVDCIFRFFLLFVLVPKSWLSVTQPNSCKSRANNTPISATNV